MQPLKLDTDGKIKQFGTADRLTVQDQVDYTYQLIQRLIIDLTNQGFVPKDDFLLNELQIALSTLKL